MLKLEVDEDYRLVWTPFEEWLLIHPGPPGVERVGALKPATVIGWKDALLRVRERRITPREANKKPANSSQC